MSFEEPAGGHLRPPISPDQIARAARLASILQESEPEPRDPLLYIDPVSGISEEPVVDEATSKITAAFRAAKGTGTEWRGIHRCACGACSDNTDYILPSGHQTNSLAVHYVALHRAEVPADQLEIIAAFDIEPEEPTIDDFKYPLKQPLPGQQ
jgi:hypothetical protein